MPLKLWLPLDGNSDNEGISGTVMTGSPASWGNGPTGKCAVFNNNAANVIYNTTTEYNYTVEDFSWCLWLKKDYSSHTANYMYAFSVGRPDAGGRGYGLWVKSSTACSAFFGNGEYAFNTTVNDNEWHHYAFTRKGNSIKLYVDGVQTKTGTNPGTLPTYSDGNGPGIGCFHYTSNIYPLVGSISDFRIYNHALSAREVYQISRALLVHFPLCSPDNAQANLLTWTRDYTETTPLVHTSSSKDGYKYLGDDSLITVTGGKTYYVQLKSDKTPHSYHASSAGVVSDKFTFRFYIRNVGTSKNIGLYDQTACFTSANIYINDPDRNLYVWKWTAPSNAQDITLRTNSYSDGSTAVTIKFWDFKIEEGAYTPYVPSTNQAQYAALGYGSSIVRDATGRRHDLTVSGTPIYSLGSVRYSTAIDFNQAGYLYNNSVPLTMTQFTVAFWMNPHSNTSDQHFIFGTFDSWTNNGVGMWRGAGSQSYAILVKSDAESSYTTGCGGQTWTANTWSHFAITWDGTTIKVYQNAELNKTTTYGLSGNCLFKNIYLGNSMFNTHPASETDEAAMSDFRIYGTALSAADVKYLYDTSASIDNTGTVFADSFEETGLRASVGKSGVFTGSGLGESGGNSCAYLSTAKVPVDPNRSSWSYTPEEGASNKCMTGLYFECIPGIQKYRIKLKITWSGFADISTAQPSFSAFFQGYTVNTSGEWVWVNVGPMNTAMQASKSLTSLAKGAASGTYMYDVEFTLPNTWPGTYKGNFIGIRTDYSNGTGTWTISKVYIYPADEHCDGLASLADSGAIRGRLVDEVELA